jgi:T5SS/PEP-CTERM-associated repeat protein
MAGSTWTWKGGSGSESSSTNWTLISGPGNGFGYPQAGDVAIDAGGTIVVGPDPGFLGNTIELGGTAGTIAALAVSGDDLTTFGSPTANAATVIDTAVPGHTTAETSVLDAAGTFVNEGTVLANGPAGSVFTIDVGATLINGTLAPGYFFNPGTIIADAGNTLIINIGASSELFNTGVIIANGGTVKLTAAPGAISGGDAPVRGFNLIEGGGTLETQASYPASDGNNGTHAEYEFADSSSGNTLKIDNVGSFGGTVIGFGAGDTVDLGTLLAVGTLAYSATTNLLSLEAANGTTLASLVLGNFGTGLATGSFALTNGTADGLIIGVGTDGDTVLTTAGTLVESSGISGTWQAAASWHGGIVPGATASASIGFGAAAAFTLTTGNAPVSVGGFAIDSPLATVRITSDTTLTTGQVSDYYGTLDIATGSTLTGSTIQLYQPSTSMTIAAGATADLAGRIDLDLAPVGGIWGTQPGGNPYAFTVSAGTAVIDGALLAGPTASTRGGSTTIGYESAGQPATVIVNAGGTVTDTHTTLGSDLTSSGTLILDGPGASWTDEIDSADTYNSRGNITVGYNDVVSDIPAGLPDPAYVATAQVVVENGATLTDQEGGSIGSSPDSAGAVTIETGGLWNLAYNGVAGGLSVATSGAGTLSVLNGGTVTVGAPLTYLNGNSAGTSVTTGGIGIGQTSGATGTILVSGAGSELSTQDGMSVGKGGQGLLEILNGGTVAVTGSGIGVGQTADAGSSGTVIVGGTGAAAFLNFGTAASGLGVGDASEGTLIVADNGTINLNGTGYLTVGSAAGSFGDVVVGGTTASAVINIGTAGLTVGNTGPGAHTPGAAGSMTVNGGKITESSTTNGLNVGQNSGAAAAVLIENGGTVSLAGGYVNVGLYGGSNGTVTVQGSGSALQLTGSVAIGVGSSGNGTLAVSNGGSLGVSGTGQIILAGNNGSFGKMAVAGGIVSLAATSGGINVGGAGSGTLTVSSNGTISDASVLTIALNYASQGSASVTSGTITATAITVGNSGSGTLGIAGGTLTDTGLLGIAANAGSSGTVTISGTSSKLTASGGIEVGEAGSGTLTVQNDTISTSNLSLGGSPTAPMGNAADLVSLSGSADIAVTGALALWAGSTVSLDTTSAIDVGTSGSFNAGTINLESGHTITGSGLIVAPIQNNGVIKASDASAPGPGNVNGLEIMGAVTGPGTLQIGNGAVLRLDAPIASGEPIQFGTGSELILADPRNALTNDITDLSNDDKIELNLAPGVVISDTAVNGTTVTVTTSAGSYQLTDVNFAAGANTTFYHGTDPNTGFQYIQVAATGSNWTGSTGDSQYNDPANWQSGQVPDATRQANFNANPGTVTGTGNALSVNFGIYNSTTQQTWTLSGINLTVAGSLTAPYLPFAAGFDANTVINGGTFNASGGTASIGNVDGATVTAEGGAKVTTLGDNIGGSGQSGSLVLTGAGTDWTELSGPAVNGYTSGFIISGSAAAANGQTGSAGYLTVTNNASLNTATFGTFGGSTGAYGAGTISAGGAWTLGGGLTVGNQGTGKLTISGGTVDDNGYTNIGQQTGSTGAVTINNGTFTAGTGLTVGNQGNGTLTLDGGTVANDGNTEIGQQAGASGTVTVNNGTFTAASYFTVGDSGTGAFNVGSGGTLLFGGNYNPIGNNAGSNGTLTITGGGVARSTLPAGSDVGMAIGSSGASGTTPAAEGNVTVSGTGSLLDLNGNELIVGNQGVGSLSVTQGATVNAGVLNSSNESGALVAAIGTGSEAMISVDGAGSTLNLTGGVGIGLDGSASLTISDDGLVRITNSPTISNGVGSGISIGQALPADPGSGSGQGEATVTSGGTLSIQGGFSVGGDGVSGVLNVNTGGTVLAGTGFTVGTATKINSTIYGGTGALNIGTGGTVLVTEAPQTAGYAAVIGTDNSNVGGPTTLATGEVSVSGSGALLNTNDNGISVGQYGNGILTVSQGGSVAAGTANINLLVGLSVGQFGDGSLVLTDPGSTMTLAGGGFIGRAGAGTGLIENHATLIVNSVTNGVSGLSIGSASGSNNSTQTSVQTGGSGDLQVTTFGDLYSHGIETVGRGGATGSIEVNTGGTVEATQQVAIGTSETISAGGSIITSSGTTIVAGTSLLAGRGIVTIGSGSLLQADGSGITSPGTADIIVGNGVGASGVLNVTGAAASVNTGGYQLAVGSAGEGSMLISQGGTVLGGTPYAADEAITIGGSAGATGGLTVTDAGSELLATGQLSVGLGGAGSLLIENQGTVVSGNNTVDKSEGFDAGQLAGSSGEVTVTGSGSKLSNTGRFVVGDAGAGSLSTVVTTPGTVTSLAGATIANAASASGSSASVTGTGSNWQITGALQVGAAGAGALDISDGGRVSATTLDAAIQAGSAADISVSGTHSALNLTGGLTLGDGATADMSILAAATVSVGGDVHLGLQANGSGFITVSDGSILNVAGTLYVGNDAGLGGLTIGNNGTFLGHYDIGSNGVLNQFGGVIDPSGPPNVNDGTENIFGGTLVGDLENDGDIIIKANKSYEVDGNISTGAGDTGLIELNQGATLSLDTSVDAGQTIKFDKSSGDLVLGDPTTFAATISNFTTGDQIIVDTTVPTTFLQTGSVVSVIENGTSVGALTFASAQMAQTALATPGAIETGHCFLPGTLVTTPSGQTPVERLAPGDLIVTASGQTRPITWVGTGRVLATRGRRNAATPVIIRKSALAPNVPHQDLRVTKGHSLYLDQVLIPVEFLVNHRSILWDDRAQEVAVYHIELATHDVLLANGAPAESYRDDGNRWLFQNANSGWDQPAKPPYAPVLTGGPIVDAVWRRLLDRSGPRPRVPLTEDPDLHLVVDGTRIDATTRTDDVHVFRLTSPSATIHIVSRAAVPQELGVTRDPRLLGFAIRSLAVRQGTQFRVAADRLLTAGFHPLEPATGLRWTNGDAVLPAVITTGLTGPIEVVVHIAATTYYVDDGGALSSVA